jgi:hypothetical protein
MPRARHSSTSYLGFSRLYETNSSDEVSEKSLIGKTLLNTPCRPVSSRCSGGTSSCRNLSYERFWMSIRLGMSMTFSSFAKVLRTRKLFWIADAMKLLPSQGRKKADRRRPSPHCRGAGVHLIHLDSVQYPRCLPVGAAARSMSFAFVWIGRSPQRRHSYHEECESATLHDTGRTYPCRGANTAKLHPRAPGRRVRTALANKCKTASSRSLIT